jgi:hypothetical protein
LKVLKGVLLALLFSLVMGFAIGTVLRVRLEKPVHYIGELLLDDTLFGKIIDEYEPDSSAATEFAALADVVEGAF